MSWPLVFWILASDARLKDPVPLATHDPKPEHPRALTSIRTLELLSAAEIV